MPKTCPACSTFKRVARDIGCAGGTPVGVKFLFDQNLLCAKFNGDHSGPNTENRCHIEVDPVCGWAESELELEKPKPSPRGSVWGFLFVLFCFNTD